MTAALATSRQSRGGAQEVLDTVSRLATRTLDDGGQLALSWDQRGWRDNEVAAGHRNPFPGVGVPTQHHRCNITSFI
jgi:hypothetical protein